MGAGTSMAKDVVPRAHREKIVESEKQEEDEGTCRSEASDPEQMAV